MAESIKKMKRFEFSDGFTLIEILIAMLILTVALLSLVSVTVMVIKGNSLNKMRNTATTLAKDKMEELKVVSYDSLPTAIQTDYATAEGVVQAGATGYYFTRTWEAPQIGTTNAKTITVTVTWPAGRTVQLKTTRAKD